MNEIIFRYLNSFAGRYVWLDNAIIFSADTLALLLLVGLIVFLFSHEHKREGFHNVIVVLSVAVFALLVSFVVKHIYPSPRPFFVMDNVTNLLDYGRMNSFPSGHAVFFSAIATVLYFYHKKVAFFYGVGAVVIGVARVVAGIHWPVDIVAGYIIGITVAFFVYHIYAAIFERKRLV